MKFTLIGLTVVAILVTPSLPGIDWTSSSIENWKSEVATNFQGVTSDYDFRSYSTNWNQIIIDTMNLYDNAIRGANTVIGYVANFFENPIVAVLDILPDDPAYPGAPDELTFWRYNEILLATVTNSRYSVMATLTNDELLWFATAAPFDNPIMYWQITSERWWIGCFCTEESLQAIAIDLL
jgi:hypothetical protein